MKCKKALLFPTIYLIKVIKESPVMKLMKYKKTVLHFKIFKNKITEIAYEKQQKIGK